MYIEPWVLWLCGVILFVLFIELVAMVFVGMDKVGDVREKLRYAEEQRDRARSDSDAAYVKMYEIQKLHADLSRQHEALIDALKKGKK